MKRASALPALDGAPTFIAAAVATAELLARLAPIAEGQAPEHVLTSAQIERYAGRAHDLSLDPQGRGFRAPHKLGSVAQAQLAAYRIVAPRDDATPATRVQNASKAATSSSKVP